MKDLELYTSNRQLKADLVADVNAGHYAFYKGHYKTDRFIDLRGEKEAKKLLKRAVYETPHSDMRVHGPRFTGEEYAVIFKASVDYTDLYVKVFVYTGVPTFDIHELDQFM